MSQKKSLHNDSGVRVGQDLGQQISGNHGRGDGNAKKTHDRTVFDEANSKLCNFAAISQGFFRVFSALSNKLSLEIGKVLWEEKEGG